MRDIRGYEVHDIDTTSNRNKLLGAAVVAFGISALGVYAFASGGSPASAPQQLANKQIRTTPEDYQSQEMPPPVTQAAPTSLDGTPLDPKATKQKPARSQQAAVRPRVPAAPPAMSPPENAVPAEPTQPAATSDQPTPQESPAPDTPQAQ